LRTYCKNIETDQGFIQNIEKPLKKISPLQKNYDTSGHSNMSFGRLKYSETIQKALK
jgi:hypothetical protein